MNDKARYGRAMRRLVAVSLAASVVHGGAVAQTAPGDGTPTRTILISVDGFRPDIYLDPERTGVKVPNLLALRDRGVAAERMIGVFPSVTYPSHTTMVTGVMPARHGIANNFKPGTTDWYLQTGDIKAEPLWRAYKRAGRSTAIVTWPASYGADVDWLVPENLSFGIADVPGAIAKGATPGLIAELSGAAGKFDIPAFEKIEAGEMLDRMTGAYAVELIRKHKPELLLLHFLDADHQEHSFGPESPEARLAFEKIDARIGGIVTALREAKLLDRTNIVIVGDHGFARIHSLVNMQVVLREAGLELGWPTDAAAWPVELHMDGAGLGFFLKAGATADRGAIVGALQKVVQARLSHLAQFLTADELTAMGGYPGAIAGLSITAEGYSLAKQAGDDLIVPTTGLRGMHGYLPDMPQMATGFIAAGPSFRQRYRLPVMRMVDLAPTIAMADRVSFTGAQGSAVRGILAGEVPDRLPGDSLVPK